MPYIYLDPRYKMMSFALVHNFPSVTELLCPFTYHLFYHSLSATFLVLPGRVNMTRVAFAILNQTAFANFDPLCMFLTAHYKQIFNKFIAAPL